MSKNNIKVGTVNQRQKNVSVSLIGWIKKYQKQLQTQENIKFGRKARHISFVFATKNPRNLAKFIMEVLR
ncbi:MAG: hypothetical protein MJK08_14635 [Campylobacterales bacterium]|nr:hypothetical protein [Campylobacterales bacterium]